MVEVERGKLGKVGKRNGDEDDDNVNDDGAVTEVVVEVLVVAAGAEGLGCEVLGRCSVSSSSSLLASSSEPV